MTKGRSLWGVLVDLDYGGIQHKDKSWKVVKIKNGVHVFRSKLSAKRWMLEQIAKAGYAGTEDELEEFQYSLTTLEYFHLKQVYAPSVPIVSRA